MASLSTPCTYRDRGLKGVVYANGFNSGRPCFSHTQISFGSLFPAVLLQVGISLNNSLWRNHLLLLPSIKCEKNDNDSFEVTVERPPYDSYMDSTSGQLEPASGARASIPGQDYWPEGTASRVRAANAPEPTGTSAGSPSYGKSPGSRRKKYKATTASSDTTTTAATSDVDVEPSDLVIGDDLEEVIEDSKDSVSEYVVYQTEPEEEETGFELDKKLGRALMLLLTRKRRNR